MTKGEEGRRTGHLVERFWWHTGERMKRIVAAAPFAFRVRAFCARAIFCFAREGGEGGFVLLPLALEL